MQTLKCKTWSSMPQSCLPPTVLQLRFGSQRRKSAASIGRFPFKVQEVNRTTIVSDAVALHRLPTNSMDSEPTNPGSTFSWMRHWWPLAAMNMLDKERPVKHVILGKSLAVWYNKRLSKFFAVEDKCPHRLAPLSQGRIIGDNLMCSYHGWKFGSDGRCTAIPQLSKESQAAACSQQRACALSYPTFEYSGLLWVWMDPSKEGLQHAEGTGITVLEGVNHFSVLQTAADYASWIEQGWDFTHANFLHHGSGFKVQDQIPATTALPPTPADDRGGIYMEHMGYDNTSKSNVLKRRFVPPHTTCTAYPVAGGQLVSQIMTVPVTPGVSRSLTSFVLLPQAHAPKLRTVYPGASYNPETSTTSPSTAAAPSSNARNVSVVHGQQQGLVVKVQEFRGSAPTIETSPATAEGVTAVTTSSATSDNSTAVGEGMEGKRGLYNVMVSLLQGFQKLELPHWLYLSSMLSDQDTVIMAESEHLQLQHSGTISRRYHLPAIQADTGVVAIDKWLDAVGYPQTLFPPYMVHASANWKDSDQVDVDTLLARGPAHVDLCVLCQKDLRFVTRMCWLVTGGAALAAACAVNLAAVGVMRAGDPLTGITTMPLLVSIIMAFVLAKVAQGLWDFRHTTYISGGRRWRKLGGLSLVRVPDAL